MRIKQSAWREKLFSPLFFNPLLYLHPFLLFPGKVNRFTQSQREVLDTPTQLPSLSTHPCQGELRPGTAHMNWILSRLRHSTCQTCCALSLKKRLLMPQHSESQYPSCCALYSNINYCYYFIMRSLKSVYPRCTLQNIIDCECLLCCLDRKINKPMKALLRSRGCCFFTLLVLLRFVETIKSTQTHPRENL